MERALLIVWFINYYYLSTELLYEGALLEGVVVLCIAIPEALDSSPPAFLYAEQLFKSL